MAKDEEKYILNEEFLNELLRMCMRRKEVMDSCIKYLKYHYISSEPHKEIFSAIKNHYINNSELPSHGTISQTIQSSLGKKAGVTLEVLAEIKNTKVVNVTDLLKKLEIFIKDSMSVEFFNEFGEKYKAGDRDGARVLMTKMADKLSTFSILKDSNVIEKVFDNFENRHELRKFEDDNYGQFHTKVPFSIDDLDELTGGGIDATDTFCFITRSGVGKTKFLRHVGVGAVRRGINVLHIQAEGSKKSCLNGYDATWTACLLTDVKKGSIPLEKYSELQKVVTSMRSKGSDIYVHAFEKFGMAGMNDVRSISIEMLKQVDSIGLILCDYLELFDPNDGIVYRINDERFRRLAVANKMKNLAVELDSRLGTCTQANNIPPKLLVDPEFVITRDNVSECKGLVNPFSFFFSGNQTPDEYQAGEMRIYVDKFREYKADKTFRIYQAYKHDRFYDKRKTLLAKAAGKQEE